MVQSYGMTKRFRITHTSCKKNSNIFSSVILEKGSGHWNMQVFLPFFTQQWLIVNLFLGIIDNERIESVNIAR